MSSPPPGIPGLGMNRASPGPPQPVESAAAREECDSHVLGTGIPSSQPCGEVAVTSPSPSQCQGQESTTRTGLTEPPHSPAASSASSGPVLLSGNLPLEDQLLEPRESDEAFDLNDGCGERAGMEQAEDIEQVGASGPAGDCDGSGGREHLETQTGEHKGAAEDSNECDGGEGIIKNPGGQGNDNIEGAEEIDSLFGECYGKGEDPGNQIDESKKSECNFEPEKEEVCDSNLLIHSKELENETVTPTRECFTKAPNLGSGDSLAGQSPPGGLILSGGGCGSQPQVDPATFDPGKAGVPMNRPTTCSKTPPGAARDGGQEGENSKSQPTTCGKTPQAIIPDDSISGHSNDEHGNQPTCDGKGTPSVVRTSDDTLDPRPPEIDDSIRPTTCGNTVPGVTPVNEPISPPERDSAVRSTACSKGVPGAVQVSDDKFEPPPLEDDEETETTTCGERHGITCGTEKGETRGGDPIMDRPVSPESDPIVEEHSPQPPLILKTKPKPIKLKRKHASSAREDEEHTSPAGPSTVVVGANTSSSTGESVHDSESEARPPPAKRVKDKANRVQALGKIQCAFTKPRKRGKAAQRCGNKFYPKADGSLYCHIASHRP